MSSITTSYSIMQMTLVLLFCLFSPSSAGFFFGPSAATLEAAIKEGDVEAVKKYIADGGDMNTKDANGNQPLAQLLQYPNDDILHQFFFPTAKVDVNAFGSYYRHSDYNNKDSYDTWTSESALCKVFSRKPQATRTESSRSNGRGMSWYTDPSKDEHKIQFSYRFVKKLVKAGLKTNTALCPQESGSTVSILATIVHRAENQYRHICADGGEYKSGGFYCTTYGDDISTNMAALIPDFLSLWNEPSVWSKYKTQEDKTKKKILEAIISACDKQGNMCEFELYKFKKHKIDEIDHTLMSKWSCKQCYEIYKEFNSVWPANPFFLEVQEKNYNEYKSNFADKLWFLYIKQKNTANIELMIEKKAIGNKRINAYRKTLGKGEL